MSNAKRKGDRSEAKKAIAELEPFADPVRSIELYEAGKSPKGLTGPLTGQTMERGSQLQPAY